MVDINKDAKADAKANVAQAPRRETVEVTGLVRDSAASQAKEEKVKLTGGDTHEATQRGYAIDPTTKAGILIEEGELIPVNQPISDEWMKPVDKKDRALRGAIEEALDFKPKDVDLTGASAAAIEALCLMSGITTKGLSKDDMILAYNAHREKDAG